MDNGDFESEEKLIWGLKTGVPKAYEKVYRDNFSFIKNLICLNSGRQDQVADILQEAIIVLYRKLQEPDFVLTCRVSTFIFAVCRNKWLKYLRNRKKTSELFEPRRFEPPAEELPDEEATRQSRQLQEAFDRLDAKCQQILIKYYFYAHSLSEITQALGFPNVNAVKVKKCRCIQKLKEDLKYNHGGIRKN